MENGTTPFSSVGLNCKCYLFPLPDFRLHGCLLVRCAPAWSWDSRHNTDWTGRDLLHLWAIAEGRGSLRTAGIDYELRRSVIFVLRTWEHHLGRHDPQHPLHVWTATFWCPGFRRDGEDLPERHRVLSRMDLFEDLAGRMIRQARRPGGQAEAEHWLNVILALLLDDDAQRQAGRSPLVDAAVEAVRTRMREDLGAGWTLGAIARACDCSVNQCIRRFRRATGETPHLFLNRCRRDVAVARLLYSGTTLAEIAEELGFADVFSFSRWFSKELGVPPGSYREGKGVEL